VCRSFGAPSEFFRSTSASCADTSFNRFTVLVRSSWRACRQSDIAEPVLSGTPSSVAESVVSSAESRLSLRNVQPLSVRWLHTWTS